MVETARSEAEAVIPLTVHVAAEQVESTHDQSAIQTVSDVRWDRTEERARLHPVQRVRETLTVFLAGFGSGILAAMVTHLPAMLIGVLIGVFGMAFLVHK